MYGAKILTHHQARDIDRGSEQICNNLLVVQIGLWVFDDVSSSSSNGVGGFVERLIHAGVHDISHNLPGNKRSFHLNMIDKK